MYVTLQKLYQVGSHWFFLNILLGSRYQYHTMLYSIYRVRNFSNSILKYLSVYAGRGTTLVPYKGLKQLY